MEILYISVTAVGHVHCPDRNVQTVAVVTWNGRTVTKEGQTLKGKDTALEDADNAASIRLDLNSLRVRDIADQVHPARTIRLWHDD